MALSLIVLAWSTAPVHAAEPPHYTFSPKPPGEILQSILFYPEGEGTQSQWRAVESRVHLARSSYQWYLSIYRIDYATATYKLVYQSPRNGGPLSVVHKYAPHLWLPLQTLHIVGEAELELAAVQNLVVESHESSADCGSSSVNVYGYDWTVQRVRPFLTVTNPCDLRASIRHPAAGLAELKLFGPYYAPGAPLCCPTKPRVFATVHYHDGRWIQIPRYFTLAVPAPTGPR
jgi:hypothetical protein